MFCRLALELELLPWVGGEPVRGWYNGEAVIGPLPRSRFEQAIKALHICHITTLMKIRDPRVAVLLYLLRLLSTTNYLL